MTEILSSTRNPDSPWSEMQDTLERIARDLAEHTLDPVFEQYGDFCDRHPEWLTKEAAEKYAGCVRFWGNFLEYSGAFDVITSDKEVIAKLSELIVRNKATPEYIAARRAFEASRAEERARRIEEWNNRVKLSEAINGR